MPSTPLIHTVSSEVDEGARTLLELSLRHGVSDTELAALLRAEPHEIAQRRADTLARLGHIVEEHEAGPTPARPTGRRKTDQAYVVPRPEKPSFVDRVLRVGAVGYLVA